MQLAIIGIENQTAVEKKMPFRLIGYDDASYKSQLQANAAPIAPVVTIVLYFGENHWCKERNIKSLMNIPKELDQMCIRDRADTVPIPSSMPLPYSRHSIPWHSLLFHCQKAF